MKRIVQLALSSMVALALEKTTIEKDLNEITTKNENRNKKHLDNADDLFKLEEDALIIETPSVTPTNL